MTFQSEQIKRREGLIPFPRVGRSGKTAGVKFPAEVLINGLDSRSVRNVQRQSPDFEDRWIASVLKGIKSINMLTDSFI